MAAVSVGDVDIASKTTMIVPGMDNNVDGSIGSLVETASAVYKEQDIPGGGKHTVIAWIGYESPTLEATEKTLTLGEGSVAMMDKARDGAHNLSSFYDGLNVTKSSNKDIPSYGAGSTDAYNDAFVSLQAHSYGTTLSAEALYQSQTKVDNVVLYDSAGLSLTAIEKAYRGQWQVEKTNEKPNIFYTAVSPNQSVVAKSGAFLGARPTPEVLQAAGAQSFSSNGGFDASGNYLEDADEHGLFERNGKEGVADYRFVKLNDGDADGILSPGTSSLYYGSRISLGDYAVVGKKLISPMVVGNEWDPESGSYPYLDANRDGRLSAEQVRRYAHEQGMEFSDLVNVGEGIHE
ncbi:alpha/beta hydrolase [Rothia amarae]|nr:alpha/beta hydrolase [Rothia amarae]